MNIRQIFGLLAAIACAGSVQAQRVGWEADFKTRFDNREFTGSSCNESQTIFLADLSTAVSYNWLDRNTLRFGVQMQKDFGDNRDYFSEVRPLASYAYRAERLGADVGIFSRDELRGDYSHAFFNDSLRVYDPTIQGMAVRYRNPNWCSTGKGCIRNIRARSSASSERSIRIGRARRTNAGTSGGGFRCSISPTAP